MKVLGNYFILIMISILFLGLTQSVFSQTLFPTNITDLSNAEHAVSSENNHEPALTLGKELPVWSIIPFLGILLSIAIFPLLAPHFWHHHFGKVSAFWALIFAIPFLISYNREAFYEILHIYLADYFPFIILLWALFTAAGGILVQGAPAGTPLANAITLLIGTFLASFIGTTGAAMVLIRPVLRMNKYRKSKVHIIIFFIFLVANIGGSLTPLGDPPLFLGFLHHVPFFWTTHLFTEMAFVAGSLLLIFFAIDSFFFRKEGWHQKKYLKVYDYNIPPDIDENKIKEDFLVGVLADHYHNKSVVKISILGLHNFLILLGIIGGVLFSGLVHLGEITIFHVHLTIQGLIRDVFLLFLGYVSLKTTAWSIREGNEFTWFPIKEVAILFAGIFMTIVPALAMLKAGNEGHLGFIINAVKEPWHYFWITGSLSSFLDNAPTYLTFLSTALGQFYAGIPETEAVAQLVLNQEIFLKAISTGAVFFGAMTYIGNAPNFMVKSISEEQKIKMPSFFGYMLWSIFILIPVFILTTFIFF